MILKRDRDCCVHKRPQKNDRQYDFLSLSSSPKCLRIIIILKHFGEDAHGRDGHGNVSKS
jgi:hypothetical protein